MGAGQTTSAISGDDEVAQTPVSLNKITCIRGSRLLFCDLDLSAQSGQLVQIIGPNGIGKSSLIRIIAGLLRPAGGNCNINGTISLCDENLALDKNLPLVRALSFWVKLDGQTAATVGGALDAMGLTDIAEVPVRMLSTGQRKRAAIARTIASGAQIWLLDEPANGLDSNATEQLGIAMKQHLDGGGVIVAASHQALPVPPNHQIDLKQDLTA